MISGSYKRGSFRAPVRARRAVPAPAQADESLVAYVERTTGLTLDLWQHIICHRLQALRHQRGQRLLIHGPPQYGKPCYNACMILMHDGSYKRLEEVRVGDYVVTHFGRSRLVTAVHIQGDLECVEIETRNGRKTTAALDHPFLTPEGWVEAGKLVPGQVLANVSAPDCGGTSERSDAEFELLGYFVGDGTVGTAGASIHANITSNDPVQADRFVHLATSLGFEWRVFQKQKTTALTYAFSGGVRQWLRDVGVAGKKSGAKVVPEWVYQGTPQQIALFLGAYFSCDGTISRKGLDRNGKARAGASIEFYSISEQLLRDVQTLLLRIGVQARLSVKSGSYIGTKHTSYRLTITSQDYIAQFARMVPVSGIKGERLREIRVYRKTFQPQLLEDEVVAVTPVGVKPCRCLTVEEDHTFTVDDLVVHNSIIVSQRMPAYLLGLDPLLRIRIGCYNVSHAARFSAVVLDLLRETASTDDARPPAIANKEEWSTPARRAARDANPSMKALGLGTGFTGLGVDVLVFDDPYKNPREARSPAHNTMLRDWWQQVVMSRLNPETNVVVMFHRWWEGDFAGWLIQQGGWELLRFPAIADGKADDPTGRAVGEPLSPRYTLDYLQDLRRRMGTAFDALYQGTPQPASGGMFKAGKVGFVDAAPADALRVRAWDLGATDAGGDYTVGVLQWRTDAGRYGIEDVIRGQWDADERDRVMRETAERDRARGYHVLQLCPQDPGQAGKSQARALVRLFDGFWVDTEIETGDKVTRADPLSSQWNGGNVDLVRAAWNEPYLEEVLGFPKATHDDQVDASSKGHNRLADIGGGWGLA
jgi:predicted phage terminase large subunit-like protein